MCWNEIIGPEEYCRGTRVQRMQWLPDQYHRRLDPDQQWIGQGRRPSPTQQWAGQGRYERTNTLSLRLDTRTPLQHRTYLVWRCHGDISAIQKKKKITEKTSAKLRISRKQIGRLDSTICTCTSMLLWINQTTKGGRLAFGRTPSTETFTSAQFLKYWSLTC